MGFDEISLEKQLSDLWDNEIIKTLPTRNNKYVIISDMHMGNGGKSDDFKENEQATINALTYYKKNGHILILLGDIEELWQFSADEIVQRYDSTIYKSIRAFGDSSVYRIFGNHDIDWKTPDPIRNKRDNNVYEGIKLKDIQGRKKILLVHGHQGTKNSDKYSSISRGFVRIYRDIEPHVKIDKTPAFPRSPILTTYERERYKWAKKNKLIIICGHSHRAVFCSRTKIDKIRDELEKVNSRRQINATATEMGKILLEKKILEDQLIDEALLDRNIDIGESNPAPNYFNTGCALYSDGITLIEIDQDTISLVKWHRKPVGKEQFSIYEQDSISNCIKSL